MMCMVACQSHDVYISRLSFCVETKTLLQYLVNKVIHTDFNELLMYCVVIEISAASYMKTAF